MPEESVNMIHIHEGGSIIHIPCRNPGVQCLNIENCANKLRRQYGSTTVHETRDDIGL